MMNRFPHFLPLLAAFLLPLALPSQEEEVPVPAEPPYEAGDLLGEGGKDIELGEEMTLNFRRVDGYIRIYFVDAERLIVEPPYESGSVRFDRDDVRGRFFYPVARLPEDLGLGSDARRPGPFNSLVYLTLGADDERFTFRYATSMDPAPVEGGD
jgi:hypothetical protein